MTVSDYAKVSEEWDAFRKTMPEIPEILEVQHNRNVLAMIPAFHPPIEYENITIREETIPVTDPQGGYITGTLETEDAICREICSQAHAVVVNVDYRKAPEYKYPVAVNDSWDALKWAIQNASTLGVDTSKVVVTGISSGGCMALVLAAKDIDEDTHYISFVAAPLPLTCPRAGQIEHKYACEFKSWEENRHTDILTARLQQYYWDLYLNDEAEEATDPYVSPVYYSRLSEFPPTFITAAGMDVIRDEGIVMAKMLSEAGVKTELVVDSGFPHWWFRFPLPSAKKGIQCWVDAIKNALNGAF